MPNRSVCSCYRCSTVFTPYTYRIHLHADFCVGAPSPTLPNVCSLRLQCQNIMLNLGSVAIPSSQRYLRRIILPVGNAHLSLRGQSDTFTAYFEYVQKTAPGPAIVVGRPLGENRPPGFDAAPHPLAGRTSSGPCAVVYGLLLSPQSTCLHQSCRTRCLHCPLHSRGHDAGSAGF